MNSVSADGWNLPENPDPRVILTEAQNDTREGRYEIALVKFVWFHEHALEIDPAFAGVRLSFALGYWHELGLVYPAALQKLEELRDVAAKNVRAGIQIREYFCDMAAINRQLGEETLTKEIFEELDSNDVTSAEMVFGNAQRALIRTKAYALFDKYIEPLKEFSEIKSMFEHCKKMTVNPRFGEEHLRCTNEKIANDASTLVAILVVNNRKDEADEIASLARAEWDDPSFSKELDKALAGRVPDPWP